MRFPEHDDLIEQVFQQFATTGIVAPPSPEVRRFADYLLLEEIARGGMGIVYRIAARSLDGHVRIFNLLKDGVAQNFGGLLASQRVPAEGDGRIVYSPHGQLMAVVNPSMFGDDKASPDFQLWCPSKSELAAARMSSGCRFVGFLKDSSVLALENTDDQVRLKRVPMREEPFTHAVSGGGIHSLAVVHSNPLVLLACEDGTVRMHPTETFAERAVLRCYRDSIMPERAPAITDVAVSRNGDIMAAGASDGSLAFWHLPTLKRLAITTEHRGPVTAVAVTSNGGTAASAEEGTSLLVWDIALRAKERQLLGHTGEIRCLDFSSNGRLLVSGDTAGVVKVWNPQIGPLATFDAHEDGVLCVKFSNDQDILATAGRDNAIKLWDLQDPSRPVPLGALHGHDGLVTSIAFSPDGTTIVSGSRDRTIKLWDVALCQELITLKGNTQPISSLDFSSDGMVLISATTGGLVRFWRGM